MTAVLIIAHDMGNGALRLAYTEPIRADLAREIGGAVPIPANELTSATCGLLAGLGIEIEVRVFHGFALSEHSFMLLAF